jgi:hypothetical protein
MPTTMEETRPGRRVADGEDGAVAQATWRLFAAAVLASAAALPAAPRLALLPMAVVFGWTQIGGV